jgi:hypothetical protein
VTKRAYLVSLYLIYIQFVQCEFYKTVYSVHVGERVKLKLILEKNGTNR